jgi:hypothetical protein
MDFHEISKSNLKTFTERISKIIFLNYFVKVEAEAIEDSDQDDHN